MKALIFDSGTLINLSMNGLLDILERLKKGFDGKFLITQAVKYEIIDRPINVGRFELGALRLQALLNSNVLEMPASMNIPENLITQMTGTLMEKANHAIQVQGQWVTLVSEAEISCLALSSLLEKKGVTTLIAIDERTTRIMCEKPQTLEQLMSERLHQRARLMSADLQLFRNYRFIRSSELVYVAYKKGLLGLEGKKALEAALYATKYHGAAISFEEIDALKKL